MELRNIDVVEIDFKELFSYLLHKLWIIILAGMIGALIAGLYSYYMMEPSYASTVKVYVINRQEEDKVTYNDLQTGLQLTKDYMILVKSSPVTEQVIKRLNLNMNNEELAKKIAVNTPEDTRILEITVNYSDPQLAKKIADMVAEISSERMINVMEIKKVNIVEAANIPDSATGPDFRNNTLLGGVAGIGIISIILFVAYLMNDTLKTAENIEKYLGITTLGSIPLEYGHRRNKYSKRYSERNIAMEG